MSELVGAARSMDGFAVDDRVSHQEFGDGVVTGTYGDKLAVDFDNIGTKRVASKFLTRAAPMLHDALAALYRERDARREKARAEFARQPANSNPDNGLVLCHCGSGRKRGAWKRYCAVCERTQHELTAGDVFRRKRGFRRPPDGYPQDAWWSSNSLTRRSLKAGNVWRLSRSSTRPPSAAW